MLQYNIKIGHPCTFIVFLHPRVMEHLAEKKSEVMFKKFW